jgi:hypothetical protein
MASPLTRPIRPDKRGYSISTRPGAAPGGNPLNPFEALAEKLGSVAPPKQLAHRSEEEGPFTDEECLELLEKGGGRSPGENVERLQKFVDGL